MEQIVKCAALAVTGALLAVTLRRSDGAFSALLGIAVLAGIGVMGLELLHPVMTFAESLQSRAGLSGALVTPVLRTLAIGLLTKIGGSICRDAGESALADGLQLAGTAASFYVMLPLMQAVLDLLDNVM